MTLENVDSDPAHELAIRAFDRKRDASYGTDEHRGQRTSK
jgi:hypothetical protein